MNFNEKVQAPNSINVGQCIVGTVASVVVTAGATYLCKDVCYLIFTRYPHILATGITGGIAFIVGKAVEIALVHFLEWQGYDPTLAGCVVQGGIYLIFCFCNVVTMATISPLAPISAAIVLLLCKWWELPIQQKPKKIKNEKVPETKPQDNENLKNKKNEEKKFEKPQESYEQQFQKENEQLILQKQKELEQLKLKKQKELEQLKLQKQKELEQFNLEQEKIWQINEEEHKHNKSISQKLNDLLDQKIKQDNKILFQSISWEEKDRLKKELNEKYEKEKENLESQFVGVSKRVGVSKGIEPKPKHHSANMTQVFKTTSQPQYNPQPTFKRIANEVRQRANFKNSNKNTDDHSLERPYPSKKTEKNDNGSKFLEERIRTNITIQSDMGNLKNQLDKQQRPYKQILKKREEERKQNELDQQEIEEVNRQQKLLKEQRKKELEERGNDFSQKLKHEKKMNEYKKQDDELDNQIREDYIRLQEQYNSLKTSSERSQAKTEKIINPSSKIYVENPFERGSGNTPIELNEKYGKSLQNSDEKVKTSPKKTSHQFIQTEESGEQEKSLNNKNKEITQEYLEKRHEKRMNKLRYQREMNEGEGKIEIKQSEFIDSNKEDEFSEQN